MLGRTSTRWRPTNRGRGSVRGEPVAGSDSPIEGTNISAELFGRQPLIFERSLRFAPLVNRIQSCVVVLLAVRAGREFSIGASLHLHIRTSSELPHKGVAQQRELRTLPSHSSSLWNLSQITLSTSIPSCCWRPLLATVSSCVACNRRARARGSAAWRSSWQQRWAPGQRSQRVSHAPVARGCHCVQTRPSAARTRAMSATTRRP